jgi:MFS family permease
LQVAPVTKKVLWKDIPRRFSSGIWVLTLVELLSTIGSSMCLPFLALYLHQNRGLSMTLVGVIILAAGLSSAVTNLIGGGLADRFSRRKLMLGSASLRVLFFLGMAILIEFSAPMWAIVAIYIIQQAIGMMVRPAITAMVADFAPPDHLTETYGILRVGRNVGWAAGPAMGGYLVTFLPYTWLFGLAGLMGAVTFFLVVFFIKDPIYQITSHFSFGSLFSAATDHSFLIFAVLCILVLLVGSQLGSTLSVFTVDREGFTTGQYGLLLTLNGLIVVVFQYPVASWVGRISRSSALMLGSVLYGIGYLSLGWVNSFNWAIGSMMVITAGEVIFSPTTFTVLCEASPLDQRGRYMGFFGLSETLSMSVGPLIGGVLLDAFPTDPRFLWGILASLGFIALVGFWRWGHENSRNYFEK